MRRWIWLFAICLAVSATPVLAQSTDPGHQAHWGVSGNFNLWQASPALKQVFDNPASMDVRGTELRVGLTHGSDLGGNTEFSYVRKMIKNGSTVDRGSSRQCFTQPTNGCFTSSAALVADNAYVDGFEVTKYVPFVTIKQRVQVGLTAGGGIGVVKGTVQKQQTYPKMVFDSRGFPVSIIQAQQKDPVPASEMIVEGIKYLPLADVEFTAGILTTPGLKLKAGGGFNFPGPSKFTFGLVYLFGAK